MCDILTLFKVLEELALGLSGDPGVPGDGGLEGNQDVVDIGRDMGLLVVDSLSSLLSPVITRLHHQGYTMMASTASLLRSLAPAHNCAVLYTNHTVSAGVTTGAAPPSSPRWVPGGPARRTGGCASGKGHGNDAQGSTAEVIYGPGTGSSCAFKVVGDGIRTL